MEKEAIFCKISKSSLSTVNCVSHWETQACVAEERLSVDVSKLFCDISNLSAKFC